MNATILGAGAWGTALAIHASKASSNHVVLWARDSHQSALMKNEGRNQKYLKDIEIPPQLEIVSDLDLALSNLRFEEDILVLGVPLAGLRETIQEILKRPNPPKKWVWLCKGIDPSTHELPHEMVQKLLVEHHQEKNIQYGVLSGPSFALEVAKGLPCALTIASQDSQLCRTIQQLLHHDFMRIYESRDIIGVELGGAVKNVLAISTGIADGLGLGLNARAALITRGMAEMTRLGVAMGAQAETFSGLTGLGDLILTATGDLSRNRKVGLAIASGQALDQIVNNLGHVAEGVRCAQAVLDLARQHHVETPIIEAVCNILFKGVKPQEAVFKMMSRDAKQESQT